MKLITVISLCLPFWLNAAIEVQTRIINSNNSNSIFELRAKNTTEKDLRNARVMVLLMDESGKVVGTQSQWLVNPNDPKTKDSSATAIEAGKEEAFKLKINTDVDTESTVATSKVVCSRMVYADGSLGDPIKEFQVKAKE